MTLWTEGMDYAIVSRQIPVAGKDWTSAGLAALTLWFQGDPNNAYPTGYANPGDVSKLYAVIDNDADPSNASKQYYDGDVNDIFVPDWHEWNAALSGFTGVALNNVQSFGIGADINPEALGVLVTIDDIRLYKARCRPELSGLLADYNDDCIVDTDDLEDLKADWLKAGMGTVTAATPDASKLIVRYVFDETGGSNVADSSGKGYNGTYITDYNNVIVEPTYTTAELAGNLDADGKPSNSFHSSNRLPAADYRAILIPTTAWTDNIGADEVTVSMWIKNVHTDEVSDGGTVIFDARIAPEDTRVFTFEASGSNSSYGIRSMNRNENFDAGDWSTQTAWTHYTLVRGTIEPNDLALYKNGVMVVYERNANPMTVPTRIYLGAGVDDSFTINDGFTGNIDDFRIYKYALSAGDALGMAGGTSHYYPITGIPTNVTIDVNADDIIDFKDYSVLGSEWLTQVLWP